MDHYRRSIRYFRFLIAILILTGHLVLTPSDAATQDNSTPQLPLPTKIGEVFVVDDFNNKVTQNDLGSDYFGGNTGATESASADPTRKITTLSWSPDSNGSTGGSLQITFDFTGQPDTSFAGYFLSVFGLTDTKVSLDGSGVEPPNSTQFVNYFLDTRDIYRDFLPWPDRSVDLLEFDARLVASGPLNLKVELRDENGSFAFRLHVCLNVVVWHLGICPGPQVFGTSVCSQTRNAHSHRNCSKLDPIRAKSAFRTIM